MFCGAGRAFHPGRWYGLGTRWIGPDLLRVSGLRALGEQCPGLGVGLKVKKACERGMGERGPLILVQLAKRVLHPQIICSS